MRFNLVDRILELEAGKRIRIVKNLTLAEEYLADHFPTFPVMPGVLMLETLVEAAAWLLRLTDNYRHSVIALRDARNVKYGHFMEPGRSMVLTVEVDKPPYAADGEVTFKGKGEIEGTSTVSAKFTMTRYNLGDRNPAWKDLDERIVKHLRQLETVLRGQLESSPYTPCAGA
jgi:3-hydroxyacyl-[acyl-carrier-protein] dehydratase